jgi:AGCS family alanine or glycine:cation symporter
MIGTFIDTIIVCSVTGLVILTSGAWLEGKKGAPLSTAAFETAIPGFGEYIVTIALAIFAFTTVLGWSHYCERCLQYLFGTKSILPFRIVWVIAGPVGTLAALDFVWLVSDTLNAMMAIPNLIALLLLSPVVFKLTKDYLAGKEIPDELATAKHPPAE